MTFRMTPLAFVAMVMAGFAGLDASVARADHRFAPRRTIDRLDQSAAQLVQEVSSMLPGNRHALRDSRQLFQSVQHLRKILTGRNVTLTHVRRDVRKVQDDLQHLQTTLGPMARRPRLNRRLAEIQQLTLVLERDLAYGVPSPTLPGRFPTAAPAGQFGWQSPGSHGMIQFRIRN